MARNRFSNPALSMNRVPQMGGGGDASRWCWEGVVTGAPKCRQRGWYCEVTLFGADGPIDEEARIGTIYAGNGYGFYFPLKVGTEVIVQAPAGDMEDLVVMPRMWNGDQVAPAALRQEDDDDEDTPAPENLILLHVEEGTTFKIVTSGEGKILLDAGDAGVEVVTTGDVDIKAAGVVNLTEDATQKALKGDLLVQLLAAHVHPSAMGPTGTSVTDFSTALSEKVKLS